MTNWLDNHLVPGWRDSWRWFSVQLAGAISALIALFSANPDVLLGIVTLLPADPVERGFMAVLVGISFFAGPWVLRVWNQHTGGEDDTSAD